MLAKITTSTTSETITVSWATPTGLAPGAFLVHWRALGTNSWNTETLVSSTRSYIISGLKSSTKYEVEVRVLVAGEMQSAIVTTAAVVVPPVPVVEPKSPIIWKADGELAGPTNNPFLEWAAYSGAEAEIGNKHPRINLVSSMDAIHGGHPPLQGKYMYRFEMKPGPDVFDNERDEMLNEEESYDPALMIPKSVMEWREGTEMWVAHAFYIPSSEMGGTNGPKPEVDWSENYYGMLPICQFHGKWGEPPTFDMGISNTRKYGGNWMAGKKTVMIPQLNADTYDNVTKQESLLWAAGNLKPDTWYKLLWHFKISANGFVELFADVGDGQGMIKRGERTNYPTLDAEWMFPCMGGPRNEGTKAELIAHEVKETEGKYTKSELEAQEPPTVIIYHDGWTFATTKAASEANLAI